MNDNQQRTVLPAVDLGRAGRVLDAIDANIVVLDRTGCIVSANKGWRDFASDNRLADGSLPRQIEVGANYLDVCAVASGETAENALLVHAGIRAVIEGRKKNFAHEYPCHSPIRQRWFLMRVKPVLRSQPREVVVTHIDITDRRLAEISLLDKQHALDAALLQLQAIAEQIKTAFGSGQQTAALWPALLPALSPALPATAHSPPQAAALLASLSKREHEILQAIVRGERNAAIAERLQLSSKSISTYRSRILEKLKVDNNAALVALVARHEAASR